MTRTAIMALENYAKEDELIDINKVSNPEEVIQEDFLLDQDQSIKIDNATDSINDAMDTVVTLENIAESLRTSGINKAGGVALRMAIEHMLQQIGYRHNTGVALEAFVDTKAAITWIKEAAIAVWEGLKKAFWTVVGWMKEFFNWVTGSKKKLSSDLDQSIKNTEELERIMAQFEKDMAGIVDEATEEAKKDAQFLNSDDPFFRNVAPSGTTVKREKVDLGYDEIEKEVKDEYANKLDAAYGIKDEDESNRVLDKLEAEIKRIAYDRWKKTMATEAYTDTRGYNIDKDLVIDPGVFGPYLGNTKREIETYIHSVKDLDHVILDTLESCGEVVGIDKVTSGRVDNLFKSPTSLEEKEFFKDKVPFKTSVPKVVSLPFKKGFVWKIEGTSIHDHKGEHVAKNVSGGVENIPYTYDVENLTCLKISEVKDYLSRIKKDIDDDSGTSNVASKILKAINERLKEIDQHLKDARRGDTEDTTANRHRFVVAKEALNALKSIEIGYWKYKSTTTVMIKQYCDASVRARKKDYREFNTV